MADTTQPARRARPLLTVAAQSLARALGEANTTSDVSAAGAQDKRILQLLARPKLPIT